MDATVEETEKILQQIRDVREKSYNYEMRSELKRLKTFGAIEPLSTYAPEEMAEAGFYSTGLDNSYQCFCCGVILNTTSLSVPPFAKHKEAQPDCHFVQGKDAGNIFKYDVRVQLPEIIVSENLNKYKHEEVRVESFQKWPLYAKTDPILLAAAGFFFTGNKDKVQCFSCNGSLANWEVDDDPWKEHAKWFPECEYLQSKKSEQEIKQYIKTYNGFTGVTGKHYVSGFILEQDIKEILSTFSDTENGRLSQSLYEDEKIRLESFKTWPQEANAEPSALAAAGFYYTGISDRVQCIGCAGILGQWEVNDVPMEEHLKHFPTCRFTSTRGPYESFFERPSSSALSPKEKENDQGNNSIKMENELPRFTGFDVLRFHSYSLSHMWFDVPAV
ncbi:baculoviral IAP repeat-containing protein 1e-like [Protopterus annectens]|uniref:baculoviral IAP repeat-containing protein 1e-like n=1 Tax=Protopterus annectens TaxID=7888 RepID=UPI001CFC2114|nr:baculoviral IAP repeat-containing protein 1e-like [Protopterus annectens]